MRQQTRNVGGMRLSRGRSGVWMWHVEGMRAEFDKDGRVWHAAVIGKDGAELFSGEYDTLTEACTAAHHFAYYGY